MLHDMTAQHMNTTLQNTQTHTHTRTHAHTHTRTCYQIGKGIVSTRTLAIY